MKHCNRCNADKDDSEFYKKQGCKDGLYSQCKKCCLEIKKLYALKKAEDIGIQYYPNLVCACGCGKQIQIKECHTRFGIPKYIHGHSTKGISKFQPLDLTKDYFCQCGCGEKIVIKRSHRFKQGIPKYIIGHQSRGEDNPCWGGGKINLVCEVCGKLFKVNKYRIVNNNIICCSRDCAGKVKRKDKDYSWNSGISDVHCEKCGKRFKARNGSIHIGGGRFCSKKCFASFYSGENSNFWKGGITGLDKQIRTCSKYKEWRLAVYIKDNFQCKDCGSKKSGNFNAHHLKHFSKILFENNITTLEQALACKELWDVFNGITLCEKCHNKRHKKEGKFSDGKR